MNRAKLEAYKALLFDLNGTMVNDMEYHINAWYHVLNEQGAGISLERAKRECYGKNHELLERIWPGRFTEEEKDRLSVKKEKKYQQDFRPHLKLVEGLDEFLESSFKEGKKMAIGSAAIRFNVDFVLDGLNIRHYFDAIVCADDVKASKPDPETWQACAEKLGMNVKDCMVFEDAPKGVEAALRARMDSIVLTTLHRKEEFDEYPNIRGFIADFKELTGHPVN